MLLVLWTIFLLIAPIIPAMIASSKGAYFILWYLYGFVFFLIMPLLWFIPFTHSLIKSKDPYKVEKEMKQHGYVECPYCRKLIKYNTIICPYCHQNFQEQGILIDPVEIRGQKIELSSRKNGQLYNAKPITITPVNKTIENGFNSFDSWLDKYTQRFSDLDFFTKSVIVLVILIIIVMIFIYH